MSKGKILVVDDEHLIRWSLTEKLQNEDYEVKSAGTGEDALKEVTEDPPDMILLDIKLPGINGMEVLEKVKHAHPDTIVIMITAHGIIPQTVQALKLGAYNYITKPFDMNELIVTINNAFEVVALRRDVNKYRSEESKRYSIENIVGKHHHMQELFTMLHKVITSDTTSVLLQGETGTGKDLVAKTIHYSSARRNKPFIEVNCATLPENLFESELFGYEKGAFTDAKMQKKGLFELADGGSVYLDEIGDMPLSMQAKLLKLIEDKTFKRLGGIKDIKVNVRVIAATNKDLTAAVEKEVFRKDLFFRLKVFPIMIVPLRDRNSDIPLLIQHFIGQINMEYKKKMKGVTQEAMEVFLKYHWPGNVRELKNILERTVILAEKDEITTFHLPPEMFLPPPEEIADDENVIRIPDSGVSLEDVEKKLIIQSLAMTENNQTQAAKLLNISRDTLRYRLKKYRIGNE